MRAHRRELGRRSRAALRQRGRDGWWLGPAPYGYVLEHHWVETETMRAGWRHRLAIDSLRAPVVSLIFDWATHENLSDHVIARRLIQHRHPHPLHPVSGRARAWTSGAVHTILANPAYLGYVVRDRTQHGVDNPPESWVWSHQRSHRALIDATAFWSAYNRRTRPLSPTSLAGANQRSEQRQEAA